MTPDAQRIHDFYELRLSIKYNGETELDQRTYEKNDS